MNTYLILKFLALFKHFLQEFITPIINQSVETAISKFYKNNPDLNSFHDIEEIFDLDETVNFLGLAKPTIYEFTSNREIPHYKKGKKLYFKKSELVQWIDSGKQKTKSELNLAVEEYLKKKRETKK